MDSFDNDNTPDEEVFDRYFAGFATAEEREIVQRYLGSQHPDAERLISAPSSLYLDEPEKDTGTVAETQLLWASLVARIAREVPPDYQYSKSHENASNGAFDRRSDNSGRGWLKAPLMPRFAIMIASVALFLAIAIPGTLYFSARQGSLAPFMETSSNLRSVVATVGQRVKYTFPDGSSAVLAPGTTLQYAEGFGRTTREVLIDGEALFTVVQDDGVPFIVKNDGASVRVLGTTFLVRQYSREATMKVVVAQGKVSVAANILTSGDAATVSSNGKAEVLRGTDISSTLSWTTGKLTFHRTPLREIIPELERWYGIQVSVTDPMLLDEQLTASFLTDEPTGAINSIASLLRVSVIRTGNHITLEPLI